MDAPRNLMDFLRGPADVRRNPADAPRMFEGSAASCQDATIANKSSERERQQEATKLKPPATIAQQAANSTP
eukprot:3788643-Pyramimonas_sp.AAC.1